MNQERVPAPIRVARARVQLHLATERHWERGNETNALKLEAAKDELANAIEARAREMGWM